MNHLSLNDEKLVPVVMELNTLLADYHLYYQKLRNFHWNILGKNFFDLHTKFEEMYSDARVKIDEIAERILTLKYHPLTKYTEYLDISAINEASPFLEDTDMVSELLDDHKKLLNRMRKAVAAADEAGDEGTIDMLGAYIRNLEKTSWMLSAWNRDGKEKLKTAKMN